MIDGKMVMLPKKATNYSGKFGGEANQRKNKEASIIFGAENSNDDNSNDEGSQNSSGKFFIDFDDVKVKNQEETNKPTYIAPRQGSNLQSLYTSPYYSQSSSTRWSYGYTNNPAVQDEENTPNSSTAHKSYELKDMTIEKALEKSDKRKMPTQSSIQSHYTTMNRGGDVGGDPNGQDANIIIRESAHFGSSIAYNSAYNSEILAASTPGERDPRIPSTVSINSNSK